MNAAASEDAFPAQRWVDRWVKKVNADADIKRLGKWFDARVLFDFGDERYILRFVNGAVQDVIQRPIWDKPWDFGIKAPESCWAESRRNPPPPFYQDIFGMMWNHGMTIEGDVVKAMQNIRVLKLVLGLMKHVA
jgi:hypothetical protein